jgi:hypothetical protein
MLTLIVRLKGGQARYRCECGAEFVASIYHVRDGATTSCGCRNRRVAAKRRTTHGHNAGGHSTKVYRAWKHMKSRCNNVKRPHYKYHGGRGITYDPAWESFENFFRDMGHPPSPRSTLERLDNSGNYSKDNCAWVTQAVQNVNKRNVVRYEYQGQSKTLGEWAKASGIKRLTLLKRIVLLGWSIELAMTTPVSFSHRIGPRN